MCVKLFTWLSSPYCRPDFDDDDDEGSKLFRYFCLSFPVKSGDDMNISCQTELRFVFLSC